LESYAAEVRATFVAVERGRSNGPSGSKAEFYRYWKMDLTGGEMEGQSLEGDVSFGKNSATPPTGLRKGLGLGRRSQGKPDMELGY
jgi:hypothetical protein